MDITSMFPNIWPGIQRNKNIFVIISLLIIALLSTIIHPFWFTGDTQTYVDSIEFLKGNTEQKDFSPFRIISTYLPLNILILGEKVFGSIFPAWIIMNIGLFVLAGYFFYKTLYEIYESDKVAFLGTMLLITNYAVVIHGLTFLMDIGGWALYLTSAYFSLRYLKSELVRYAYLSATFVAIGILFKEYAFGGLPVLIGSIIYLNRFDLLKALKIAFLSCLIALSPVLILHLFIYFRFGYTYFDWYTVNKVRYGGSFYHSRTIEFIKSFGAVYGFGWLLFLSSLFLGIKNRFKSIDKHVWIYLFLLFIAASPIFFWPGIVPRVIFVMVPPIIIFSSMILKYTERYWYWFVPLVFSYAAWSYLLDAYIFDFMNIDLVLKYILFWLY